MERCFTVALSLAALLAGGVPAPRLHADEPIRIDADRQLFLDENLVEKFENAAVVAHSPVAREVVMTHDAPWEGNVCCYHTVFRDGNKFRMYYRGAHVDDATGKQTNPDVYCYAESTDGVRWTRPSLGLHEHQGSRDNNIILIGVGAHNLAPFLDRNPACTPDARYKAVAAEGKTLIAFKSPDGIRWSRLGDKPIVIDGAFDSLNLAFWDEQVGQYRAYYRDFRNGIRDVKTATSDDFLQWSPGQWLDHGDAPAEHLYTNAIAPYERAPQWLLGLPMRYVPGRNPEKHSIDGVSDALLLSSRDGVHFQRRREAFIRPGMQRDRWVNRNNLPAWGILETTSPESPEMKELSIYATEGYYRGPATRLRRYTLRLDGFASINAGAAGGEFITRPLMIDSSQEPASLAVNCSTSASGSVVVEMQDEAGAPIPGFAAADCQPIVGDGTDLAVAWTQSADWEQLAGRPIRLKFVLKDADVYSFKFNLNR